MFLEDLEDLGFCMSNVTIMPICALSDFAHNFEFNVSCALKILRDGDCCNRFLSCHLLLLGYFQLGYSVRDGGIYVAESVIA